jgi:arylsulfatase A-like enzyme
VDIGLTILDLLGYEIPDWMEGESLKKALYGNYQSTKPKFSMNLEKNSRFGPIKNGRIAVISNEYKYIYDIGKDSGELYNLKKDPKEQQNLADTEKTIAQGMKRFIMERIRKKS